MKKNIISTQALTICLFVLAAAAGRLITNEIHLWNFAPIAAMGLFAGSNFKSKIQALLIPVSAMLLTDMVLGLHKGMIVIYGTFAVITCIGFWLKNHYKAHFIVGAALVSSVIFFAVTNFGVWFAGNLYSHDFSGLIQCYIAAIPFIGNPANSPFTINSFAGDLFYTCFLFGGYELAKKSFPSISAIRN